MSNSQEALLVFRTQADLFDLVITDQTIPKMPGAVLTKKLLEIKPDVPVILYTGYSSLVSQDKAKTLGARAFLMKPIDKEEIARTIRKILAKNPAINRI